MISKLESKQQNKHLLDFAASKPANIKIYILPLTRGVGRKDWYYIHLPKLLAKRLDQFLDTPKAKSMGMTNKSELLRHVINEFLDKHESFYNNLESISDFILEMRDRDHMAIAYNEKSQFEEIVMSFVKRGLNYNQMCILVISGREEKQFIEALNVIQGIDSLFNSQDILMLSADECFHEQTYAIEPLFTRLRSISKLVREKSKSGLSIIGTLPALAIEHGRYEDSVNIENRFHEKMTSFDIPITALCVYKSIPDNLTDRLSECHDVIIKHAITSTGLL